MTVDTQTGRLQHIVLLRFSEPLPDAEDAELRSLARDLEEIEPLRACRFGSDLTGERTRGYQYLLYTEFDDADGLASYVVHPVHQRFVAYLDARRCERLAFDYLF